MTDKRKPTTVAELAAATADSIESGGWTRGAFERDGRMCAVGHARFVMTGLPYGHSRLADRLSYHRFGPGYGAFLPDFNDAQPSKQQVIKALREFAAEHGVTS